MKRLIIDAGAETELEGGGRWKKKRLQHRYLRGKSNWAKEKEGLFPCGPGQRQGVEESRWRRGM